MKLCHVAAPDGGLPEPVIVTTKTVKKNAISAFLFTLFAATITGHGIRIPEEAQPVLVSCEGRHKPVTALIC